MALLTIDFYSKELKMSTLLTVIVPDSVRIGETPLSRRKCLYLLHGLSDDSTAFARFTKAEIYVQETGIVVVSPSVGRSMYCDDVLGQNYFKHVADEVPEYLELLMGLSRKREDNYIAGISMGGMGAAKVALTYPERFMAVGLFSGLLDFKQLPPELLEEHDREFPFLMAEADSIDSTPLNPVNLLDAKKHADLKILVRCGEQDFLYGMSRIFYEKAKRSGLDVKGIFEPGDHEWRLWDGYIDDFIKMIAETE